MRPLIVLTAATLLAGSLAAPVFALGRGNGSNTPNCPQGQVYSQQKKMCVTAQSGVIDDKSLAD